MGGPAWASRTDRGGVLGTVPASRRPSFRCARSAIKAAPGPTRSGPKHTFPRRGRSEPTVRTRSNLSVYGPNGFLRTFKGTVAAEGANLGVVSTYQVDAFRPGITLNVHNRGAAVGKVSIRDAYTGQTVAQQVEPGRSLTWHWSLEASFGWYDLTIVVESDSTFERRLAGHVETGSDSVSDPAIGA